MIGKLKKSKRGLSPVIAVILLLMMTVAAAGAAFYWLSRIQGQMQGGVESYEGRIFENMASNIDVLDADYSTSTENITMFLQNTGNRKIPLLKSTTYPTTTWALKDQNQVVVCSTDWSGQSNAAECAIGCGATAEIDIGQIKKLVVNTAGSDCDISTHGEGKAFTFTIDFSGEASTSGSFIT